MSSAKSSIVTRDDVHEAVRRGDLATIVADVVHMQVEITTTEAYVKLHKPTDPKFKLTDGSDPWFLDVNARWGRHHLPLVHAARAGHTDVIEWALAPQQVKIMRATLALLLPSLLLYDDARSDKVDWPSDPHILEILLESEAFQLHLSEETKQRSLDDVAMCSRSPALVQLAIAHGARINHPETLAAVARFDRTGVTDVLVAHGMLAVGADVIHVAARHVNMSSIEQLLKHGADWGNATSFPLVELAGYLSPDRNLVGECLAMGSFDVDARGENGKTALMAAKGFVDDESIAPNWGAANSLLEYGADETLRDGQGRTADEFGEAAVHTYGQMYLDEIRYFFETQQDAFSGEDEWSVSAEEEEGDI